MILLSNGGTNAHRSRAASDTMVIGTVDGVVLLERGRSGLENQAPRARRLFRQRRHRVRGRHLVCRDPRFWRRRAATTAA